MRFYELTYFISPKLDEKEARDFSEEISNFIREKGGMTAEIPNPQRRRLPYPIKKEVEAYFVNLNFYFEPENVGNFTKDLDAKGQIIRYAIFTKESPKKSEAQEKPVRTKKIEESVPDQTREKIKKEKVELVDLEKKLEEILGE